MNTLDKIAASNFIQEWYREPAHRIGGTLLVGGFSGMLVAMVADLALGLPFFWLAFILMPLIFFLTPLLAKRHGMHNVYGSNYRGLVRVRKYMDLTSEERKQLPPNMLDMLGWDDTKVNQMFDTACNELYALRSHFAIDKRSGGREALENSLKDIQMTRQTYDELA